jgi:hypothetical protein
MTQSPSPKTPKKPEEGKEMRTRRLNWSLVGLLIVTTIPIFVKGQTNAGWAEWETLRPEGEEFSIMMPKNPSVEMAKMPYHKMELTTRLYLSSLPNGPVVAVASFSGIKSNPAQYTELERFNSYVDAFKGWFPEKATGKAGVAKMTLAGNKSFHGYDGRVYNVTIGTLNGVVNAYVTRKRFYAIVSLNTKKDEELQAKFIGSFDLPDKPPPQPAAVAENQEPAPTATEAKPNPANTDEKKSDDAANQTKQGDGTTDSGAQNANAQNANQKKGPINGGILNSKAIYLPLPEIPPGDVGGIVMVQVLVDEQGGVVDARAVSGPPQFHAAAVNCARLARFTPTMLMGEPVKVTGQIRYNFTRSL